MSSAVGPMIFAIDPGPERSSLVSVLVDQDDLPLVSGELEHEVNDLVRQRLADVKRGDIVAIEMMRSTGLSAGSDQFETCRQVGRFEQLARQVGATVVLVTRDIVKLSICESRRAKDGDIRQAIINRFGPGKERAIGTKKCPGPLYGVHGHQWAALALALAVHDGCERYDYLTSARGGRKAVERESALTHK